MKDTDFLFKPQQKLRRLPDIRDCHPFAYLQNTCSLRKLQTQAKPEFSTKFDVIHCPTFPSGNASPAMRAVIRRPLNLPKNMPAFPGALGMVWQTRSQAEMAAVGCDTHIGIQGETAGYCSCYMPSQCPIFLIVPSGIICGTPPLMSIPARTKHSPKHTTSKCEGSSAAHIGGSSASSILFDAFQIVIAHNGLYNKLAWGGCGDGGANNHIPFPTFHTLPAMVLQT